MYPSQTCLLLFQPHFLLRTLDSTITLLSVDNMFPGVKVIWEENMVSWMPEFVLELAGRIRAPVFTWT